jgi:hypothetical protein
MVKKDLIKRVIIRIKKISWKTKIRIDIKKLKKLKNIKLKKGHKDLKWTNKYIAKRKNKRTI